MPGEGIFLQLERSAFGETVRTAPYAYPALETMHLAGISLLLGTIVAVDLRLLGVGRRLVSVRALLHFLLPLSRIGFALALITGCMMFGGIAASVVASAAAPWKFALLVLAGVNVAAFHRSVFPSVATWDLHVAPPWAARISAIVSLACWGGVLTAGRLLAYV